ncbi:hypothetical protein NL676_017868 [Syzygium grande]|nr:hypothetical protein NL676_017868 [Syzygium grande]
MTRASHQHDARPEQSRGGPQQQNELRQGRPVRSSWDPPGPTGHTRRPATGTRGREVGGNAGVECGRSPAGSRGAGPTMTTMDEPSRPTGPPPARPSSLTFPVPKPCSFGLFSPSPATISASYSRHPQPRQARLQPRGVPPAPGGTMAAVRGAAAVPTRSRGGAREEESVVGEIAGLKLRVRALERGIQMLGGERGELANDAALLRERNLVVGRGLSASPLLLEEAMDEKEIVVGGELPRY